MPTQTADVFQVIADPSRRRILEMLTKKSCNINSISEKFEMSRPAVSKHIKVLERAGFVSIQDLGRERYCSLNQRGFDEIRAWMNYFDNFWNDKLKNLEKLLNNTKTVN